MAQFPPIIPRCDWPKPQTPELADVFSSRPQHPREAVRQMTHSCPSHYLQGPGWSHLPVAPNTTLPVGLTEADAAPVELQWSVIRDLLPTYTV